MMGPVKWVWVKRIVRSLVISDLPATWSRARQWAWRHLARPALHPIYHCSSLHQTEGPKRHSKIVTTALLTLRHGSTKRDSFFRGVAPQTAPSAGSTRNLPFGFRGR